VSEALTVIDPRWDRVFWAGIAVLCALGVSALARWELRRLAAKRPEDPRRLVGLRRGETALVLLDTLVRYGVIIAAVFAVVSIFVKDTTAALGGGALVVLLVAFSAQRFLQDVSAGFLILTEGWYAVGDFVTIRPEGVSGVVEAFGLRTTVLRSLNGDRHYVPNGQIVSATRSPGGFRRYSIELLTRDVEAAHRAIAGVGIRAPAGEARFLRPPEVVEEREVGEGVWLVRARADVPPTMEWLAENLLISAIKNQMDEGSLVSDPIVYTLDETALQRYERRVLIP
jgi:small conductance mechanosensitive channel